MGDMGMPEMPERRKMVRIGVDPGIAGAVAVFENDELINVLDLPVVRERDTKLKLDPAALAARVRDLRPDSAMMERVGAMPGQGVTSMFNFGRSVGVIEGVLGALAIPVSFVAPATWKRVLNVGRDKRDARARASQLLPYAVEFWPLAKHHGRAEAALIGLYSVRMDHATPVGSASIPVLIEW